MQQEKRCVGNYNIYYYLSFINALRTAYLMTCLFTAGLGMFLGLRDFGEIVTLSSQFNNLIMHLSTCSC